MCCQKLALSPTPAKSENLRCKCIEEANVTALRIKKKKNKLHWFLYVAFVNQFNDVISTSNV